MANFANAIWYPVSNVKNFLIGLVLSFLFFRLTNPDLLSTINPITGIILIIVGIICFILVAGYIAEVVKLAISKKKDEYPRWNRPDKMFLKGILGTIITIIYAIPFTLIAIAILGKVVANLVVLESSETLNQSLAVFSPGAIFITIIFLLTLYLWPYAITKWAEKWKFTDAFRLPTIFKKTFKLEYFNTWAMGAIYLLLAVIVLNYIFTNLIPIVGSTIANSLLLSGIGITLAKLFGDLSKELAK